MPWCRNRAYYVITWNAGLRGQCRTSPLWHAPCSPCCHSESAWPIFHLNPGVGAGIGVCIERLQQAAICLVISTSVCNPCSWWLEILGVYLIRQSKRGLSHRFVNFVCEFDRILNQVTCVRCVQVFPTYPCVLHLMCIWGLNCGGCVAKNFAKGGRMFRMIIYQLFPPLRKHLLFSRENSKYFPAFY